MITDGQCTHTYLSRLYTNAAALRGGGGKEERLIWSIGVGAADLGELRNISGDANKVLGVTDYKKIAQIKKVSLFWFFH